MRLDDDFRLRRLLVRRRNARKVLDLTGPSLFVQALWVTLLGDLEGNLDKDLDKGNGVVLGSVSGGGGGVELAGCVAVGAVGGDE